MTTTSACWNYLKTLAAFPSTNLTRTKKTDPPNCAGRASRPSGRVKPGNRAAIIDFTIQTPKSPLMRWDPKTADKSVVEHLAAELSLRPSLRLKNPQIASTLARLLVMRGISDAETGEQFLTPALAHLHSPYLMRGMKTAVDRIESAIENKES